MKILVLNAGSSSIKYSLFAMTDHSNLLTGIIERIGESQGLHRYRLANSEPQTEEKVFSNHQQALQELFQLL